MCYPQGHSCLVRTCGRRRALTASVEATLGVVSALGERPEGAESSDTGRQVRSLLRERDELALSILRMQQEIDQVREQRITQAERTAGTSARAGPCADMEGARFHAINALQTTKEVRDAGTIQAQPPPDGTAAPGAAAAAVPEQRLDLLKGVLTVRSAPASTPSMLTTGTRHAMSGSVVGGPRPRRTCARRARTGLTHPQHTSGTRTSELHR